MRARRAQPIDPSASGPGARLRRTWPQRAVLTFNGIAVVAALGAAGVLTFAKVRVDQVPRVFVDSPGFLPAEELANDAPRNVLIVGADDATTLGDDAAERAGREQVTGIRSDTIMVVRLDPAAETARILSFPRDLWVDIPGHGANRINASLEIGGARLLVDTLQAEFGLQVNSYVQLDFRGFQRLVEEVDGVPIWFDTPVADGSSEGSSGLNIESAGCTTLDGVGALQYVRSRHLYRIIDGERVYDGTSDLGRIERQQDFIERLMERAIDQGARDPRKLASYLTIATEDITLDQGTTGQDLLDLAAAFRRFDPDALQTATVPSVAAERNGASVQVVLEREAAPLLARFRDPGPGQFAEAIPVAVAVSNGTGGLNEATRYADALAAPGFPTTVAADRPPVERTEIRYPPGAEADAAVLASFLDADPTFVPDAELRTLVLVTGPDLRGVRTSPVDAAAPTTTTTAAPSTTEPSTGEPSTGGASSAGSGDDEVVGYVPGEGPASCR
jgi:LCP family protein required for cell wall assembly